MAHRIAAIRLALGCGSHLFKQGFKLAAANVLEVHAVGPPGGRFIVVDRDLQLAPDPLAQTLGELYAVLQRHSLDRDERHNVRGADARVRAPMHREIDERNRRFHAAESGFGNGRGRAHEGQHAAIVVGIRLAVEQYHLGHGHDALHESVDFGCVAAFGEIGNTLNELSGHVALQRSTRGCVRRAARHSVLTRPAACG